MVKRRMWKWWWSKMICYPQETREYLLYVDYLHKDRVIKMVKLVEKGRSVLPSVLCKFPSLEQYMPIRKIHFKILHLFYGRKLLRQHEIQILSRGQTFIPNVGSDITIRGVNEWWRRSHAISTTRRPFPPHLPLRMSLCWKLYWQVRWVEFTKQEHGLVKKQRIVPLETVLL